MKAQAVEARVETLLRLLESRERLLVMTHTNPDPDSMGSGMGLRHLVRERLGMESAFGLTGRVMRAENRTMVRELGIDLTPVRELDFGEYDCIALVDTQPGFGHTVLPEGRNIDIVLDHHVPPTVECKVPPPAFEDLRTDAGATSSIVTSYCMQLGVPIPPNVATALFYGIRTDTADLSRDTYDIDLNAYEHLTSRVDRTKLAEITKPHLPLAYFKALRDALSNMRMYGDVVLCSIGKASSPEMVAEVADLLVRLEGQQTVFCGGLYDETYYVSVRDERRQRDAWYLIRDALDGEGSFGGHGSVAGGSIPLVDKTQRGLKRLERRLERNILKSMGEENTTVSRLVED